MQNLGEGNTRQRNESGKAKKEIGPALVLSVIEQRDGEAFG